MDSKYSQWFGKYSFENCGVGRREHGKFLMSYITGEKDGFVLNLNGEWGSGKTEFLRRMYTGLSESHPVIYIDAWESDFTNDPLLVVASELINQLNIMFEVKGNDLDRVKSCLGKFVKGAAIAGAGFLTKTLVDDASIGIESLKAYTDTGSKEYLEMLKHGYSSQIEAIDEIRKELENLAESLESQYKKQLPVVVLVDELDRCRPNYSIEMLEVIKHFFTTKNFVFVVATDSTQLQKSIKAVYGADFDSKQYLKRFFNREARLAPPDLKTFIEQYQFDVDENITLYPLWSNQDAIESMKTFLVWGAQGFGLELRDIDQTVAKLQACLRDISNKKERKQIVNSFSLIMAILEFEANYTTFMNRKDGNPYAEYKSIDFSLNSPSSELKLTFSKFYALNMKHSVKHRVAESFPKGAKRLVLAGQVGDFRLNPERESDLLLEAERSIHDVYRGIKRDDKFWLWDDFKKVVSLANTIE